MLKKSGFKEVVGVGLLDEEIKDRDDVIKSDIHEMPFEDEEFDYVISKETMEHMLSPMVALFEINRVMKTKGKFVHYISTGITKQRDWYHTSCFPDWVWADLMLKAGFRLSEIREDIMQIKYSGFKEQKPG